MEESRRGTVCSGRRRRSRRNPVMFFIPMLIAAAVSAATAYPIDQERPTHQEHGTHKHAADHGSAQMPLLEGLGDWRHRITTTSPEAQRYFDQGLRLTYGFNHDEAVRSF